MHLRMARTPFDWIATAQPGPTGSRASPDRIPALTQLLGRECQYETASRIAQRIGGAASIAIRSGPAARRRRVHLAGRLHQGSVENHDNVY